jgi:hypothetical protein
VAEKNVKLGGRASPVATILGFPALYAQTRTRKNFKSLTTSI